MSSACNCCEEPPGAGMVLQCVSATTQFDTPCGSTDPDQQTPNGYADPPVLIRYCKKITEYHAGGGGYATQVTTYSISGITGECESHSTCSGSFTITYESGCILTGTYSGETCDLTFTKTGGSEDSICSGNGVLDPPEPSTLPPLFEGCAELVPTYPDFPAWPPADPDGPPVTLDTGQGTACTATSETAIPLDRIIKRKTKWRIKHYPTGTCYLKVWFRKTTTIYGDPSATPPGADVVTHDDTTTYEWTGTGNPCITNPDAGVYGWSNAIFGSEHINTPPDVPGSIAISILKFSYLPGYEPDVTDPENHQPNGYPDPTWEVAAP